MAGGPGNRADWIGLYTAGAPDVDPIKWNYLNGTRTLPETGLSAATLTFTMQPVPGPYQYRFFSDGTHSMLATSATVTVRPPTLTLNKTVVAPGGRVTVWIAHSTGYILDRVSMHARNGSDQAVLKWKYMNGTHTPPLWGVPDATLTFKMPLSPGTYDFRFFMNTTGGKIATSAMVTVR